MRSAGKPPWLFNSPGWHLASKRPHLSESLWHRVALASPWRSLRSVTF
jgi:hypothetical protein